MYYERTCRGKRGANRGLVGLIHCETEGDDQITDHDDISSQHENPVGWVNNRPPRVHGWDSDSFRDYVVMSIRGKKEEIENKVAVVRLPLRISVQTTTAWIISGSPTSIFTIGELRKTLGKEGVKLLPLGPNENQFCDYKNNPLKFMGKMKATLTSNGWSAETYIKVIGGFRPSIIGRDLTPQLRLQLGRADAGEVMIIQGHSEKQDDMPWDDWQLDFSKQFLNLFNRVGRNRNDKTQADFFKTLVPVQQKIRRVPIRFQVKVDRKIEKLLSQGHIEKFLECSDKYFVSPIVITVKKEGSAKLALESRD